MMLGNPASDRMFVLRQGDQCARGSVPCRPVARCSLVVGYSRLDECVALEPRQFLTEFLLKRARDFVKCSAALNLSMKSAPRPIDAMPAKPNVQGRVIELAHQYWWASNCIANVIVEVLRRKRMHLPSIGRGHNLGHE